MPTQNSNLNTTWTINTSDDTWTLGEGATITTDNMDGVYADDKYTGNTIDLLGDVVVSGLASGVSLEGSYNELHIGVNSLIDATAGNVGVRIAGQQTSVDNDGKVRGFLSGIEAAAETEIVNSGLVTGGFAIQSDDGGLFIDNSGKLIGTLDNGVRADGDDAKIINRADGLIKGPTAVEFHGEGDRLTNFGKIIGTNMAIVDGEGSTVVINRGLIKGNVDLGTGDDRFDTRKGTLTGEVDGGAGQDTYLVSSQDVKISELADHGGDTVKSTVSYTLGANLETLTLLGKKDIDATGNGAGNVINGNSGDNVLRGKGGGDSIISGRGDDLMLGGKGDDVFDFGNKSGHDVIGDFQDGLDLINTDFVKGEDDFNDMMANHLKVKGDDLLIRYGDDSLLIKDMDKADLDMQDFLIGL
jgi:Ca2+-binding RTX toxin-like protein